jgi:hypothetical protein
MKHTFSTVHFFDDRAVLCSLPPGLSYRSRTTSHVLHQITLLTFFQVDFCSLQVNTLRRYKRHYKLQTRPGLNKAQLVEVRLSISSVESHWCHGKKCVGLNI